MADRPWGECNKGKALTQNWLARRLKPFSIRPEKVGPESKRVSGCRAECFDDAFDRYIFPARTGQPDSGNEINDLDETQTGQQSYGCPDGNSSNLLNLNDLSGCPDGNREFGVRTGFGTDGTDGGCVKTQVRDRRMVGWLAVSDCRISTDLLRSMSF